MMRRRPSTIRYLVDTSAIVLLPRDDVAAVLKPLLDTGQVATCGPVELALLACLQTPEDYADIRTVRAASFHWLDTVDADYVRAVQVQGLLVEQGHLSVGHSELLVAAIAERHAVTLLHIDAVFERIAETTGQAMARVGRDSMEGASPP
jgi:predicted nucleic acid-binding protein